MADIKVPKPDALTRPAPRSKGVHLVDLSRIDLSDDAKSRITDIVCQSVLREIHLTEPAPAIGIIGPLRKDLAGYIARAALKAEQAKLLEEITEQTLQELGG